MLDRILRKILSSKKWRSQPYSGSIYESVIENFLRHGFHLIPFGQLANPLHRELHVRHDIDTDDCLRNVGPLLELDVKLGVPSSWFFRLDDMVYSIDRAKDVLDLVARSGKVAGVHSTSYLRSRDSQTLKLVFQEELTRASQFLDSSILPVTIHGEGLRNLTLRRELENTVRSGATGEISPFTIQHDIHDTPFGYQHVFDDSRLLRDGSRYLGLDFKVPHLAAPCGKTGFLSHPGYWQG